GLRTCSDVPPCTGAAPPRGLDAPVGDGPHCAGEPAGTVLVHFQRLASVLSPSEGAQFASAPQSRLVHYRAEMDHSRRHAAAVWSEHVEASLTCLCVLRPAVA